MYAAKMGSEGAAMYDAAIALRDAMLELEVAVDGGKDSLSMAAAAGERRRCCRRPAALLLLLLLGALLWSGGKLAGPSTDSVPTWLAACALLRPLFFLQAARRSRRPATWSCPPT